MANDSPAKSLVDIDLSSLRVSTGAGGRGGGPPGLARPLPGLRGRWGGSGRAWARYQGAGGRGRMGGALPRGRAGGPRPWAAFPLFACIGMCVEKQGATAARRQQPGSLAGLCQQPSPEQKCNPASLLPFSPPPLLPLPPPRTPLGFLNWWKWLAMARTGKSTRFVSEFILLLLLPNFQRVPGACAGLSTRLKASHPHWQPEQ